MIDDPDRLRAFLAVLDVGSTLGAGRRLGRTQPTVSRQIQILEDALGAPLFARSGRGMVPLEAARALERHARPLVAGLDRLAERTLSELGTPSGAVTLALPPSMAGAQTVDLVAELREGYPEVRVRVMVALSGGVYRALLAGRADLGVLYRSMPTDELETEVLFDERLAAPLGLPSPGHGLRELVAAHALARGIAFSPRYEIDSLRVLSGMVARGLATTILPPRAIADEAARGILAATPIRDPALVRVPILARHAQRPETPAARVVADALRRIWRPS